MLNKTFARGIGAGKGPVDYCVNPTVPKFDPVTRRRILGEFITRDPAPVVLSGDPASTRALIDSIDNKWKYTSGVIPFTREDAPTPDEVKEVIRTFEAMAFAGLEKDQYDCLWVMHQHEGNIELHYVTPRVELGSGKALNICPPGYLKMFDAWRDEWNWSKGWSRPDDPGRAKLVQVGDHLEKTDAARLKAGLEKSGSTKSKEEITEWLVERIKSGQVKDRADVLTSLAEIGNITRMGGTYISLQPEGFTKAFRLKGGIYGESFKSAEFIADLGIEESQGFGRGGQRDERRAAEARERLAEAVQRRADYHCTCYHPERKQRNADLRAANFARAGQDATGLGREVGPDASPARSAIAAAGRESFEAAHGETSRADRQADQAIDRITQSIEGGQQSIGGNDGAVMAQAGIDKPGDLGQYLRASLGADAIPGQPSAEQLGNHQSAGAGDPAAASHIQSDLRQDPGADVGSGIQGGQQRAIPSVATGGGAFDWLESWKSACSEAWDKVKGLYDRARKAIDGWLRETGEAIRVGTAAAAGANQSLVVASGAVITACRAVDAVTRRVRSEVTPRPRPVVQQFERTAQRALGNIKANRDDELARFKTDINLVSYCAGFGYEIEKAESSRTSTIMRSGGEKIGVAVDTDGHWVYSDLKNEGKGGSIIDFVQNTQGLNLGQVRKELRGAAGQISQIPIAQRPRKPEPSSHLRQAVQHAYITTRPINGHHDYLEQERGIESETLTDPRFELMVKTDIRGNAIFPHHDDMGLSGYEIRGQDFKGFSKHGEKTIWHSANLNDAPQEIVFVEGAINALSHAQLHPNPLAAYVSIGGQMSQEQQQLVAKVMRDAAQMGAVIVFATDGDEAGEKHAQALRVLAPAGAAIKRDRPEQGMDWNDQLRWVCEQERQREYPRMRPN